MILYGVRMIGKEQRVEAAVFQILLVIIHRIYQIDPFSPEFHDTADSGLLIRGTGGVSGDDPGTFGGHRTAGRHQALEGRIRDRFPGLVLELHILLVDLAEGTVFSVHP